MERFSRARLGFFLGALAVTGLSCKEDPKPDAGPACSSAADCGTPANACVLISCENAQCVTSNVAAGTKIANQTANDCKANTCDGAGAVIVTNDDADVPSDSNDCTDDVCTGGVASHPPRAAASACGTGGMLQCDGQGACVDCINASDCGTDTECQTHTCTAGVCGVNNVPAGTALATQTAGDCKVEQCDGMGATETANADSDVPVDATACTANTCTAGVPSNPPVTVGTACSEGTGTMCDAAGACVECVMASDCPGSDSECQTRTCTAGVCGVSFTAQGTAVASQTANDCKKNVCNGSGMIVSANDAADLPNDNNQCTTDTCMAGMPTFTNVTAGATCGGTLVCNATGQCVGCNAPSDCPGSDDECKTRTCSSAGVCGFNFAPDNTLATAQTNNDCKHNVCDGSGNIVNRNDDADHPVDDGNQCTSQSCSNGMPTFPPVPVNTTCSQNNGSVCNATGSCVACTQASQCPGSDTECQTRTCVSNVCGVSYAPNTTVVASQTTGDCRQNRCNGAGAIVSVNLDTDVPADDGNQCTSQSCSNGAPVFPPVAVNTMCTQNNGSFCSAAGTCVACNQASQCTGSDTECQTRTCVSNTCGFNYAPNTTVTTAQTAGDCKQNRCNGSGAIVAVSFDADLPADDGNQCTSQTCSNGTPTFPAVAPNTTCSQNNGTVCSGTTCVQCTQASQCPGSDNECQTRTCISNVCGFSYAPNTTVTSAQTAGDCKQNRCNGSGSIVAVSFDTDIPAEDGNECTAQVCNSGVPGFPAMPVNTTCNQNNGSFCNGSAACVACNVASQCPGSDTECSARTCSAAGTCGTSFTQAGTAVATQTPNDCKQNQCDGAGTVVTVNFNGDVPADDGNQCTGEVCNAGLGFHPPSSAGTTCNQNGGSVCDGNGFCGSCTQDTDCPSGNACQTPKCNAGTCGFNNLPSGTVAGPQTPGDCQQNQCDGNGAVVSVSNNADVPADDGNQCTSEVCNAGVPSHPNAAIDTACNQNGGTFCSSAGTCVACNAPSQCPGTVSECATKTCVSNTCGTNNAPLGTITATQVPGDCKQNQCDGNGNVVSANSSIDTPADDGNQCTAEVCNAGVPGHPAMPVDTACTQNGGFFCSSAATCVQCNAPTQCSGTVGECVAKTCDANVCGTGNKPAGTVATTQTPGDCKQNECDGNGAVVSAVLNTDLPVDANQCTDNVCTNGLPSNPNSVLGTTCNQSGGTVCNGTGTCAPVPGYVSSTPANGATGVFVPSSITITFSTAMNGTTLTTQTSNGACSGSLMLSTDNFATCIGFTAATASMNGTNTIATITPAPAMPYGSTLQLRITTAATSQAGIPLASQSTIQFDTATDSLPGVVISQVYAGGGNTGATYTNDFIELHNRSAAPVVIGGWSLQYASAGNNSWSSKITIDAGVTLGPGRFFLIQAAAGSNGGPLPIAADTSSGAINMGVNGGKLALVNNSNNLANANCVVGVPGVVDLIGYGTMTVNCWETSPDAGVAPAQTVTTVSSRKNSGCQDTNDNSADFQTVDAGPRNSNSPAVICPGPVLNEQSVGGELDYCNLQFPTSLTVQAGTSTGSIYAQAFEAGSTEAMGAATNLQAQIGYGPANVNPENQSGWLWTPATFNTNVGNNDEWTATLTAPATAGTYKYTARFSYDGTNWTYCDLNGAGSNSGLTFETTQLPTLTVTP